MPKIVDHGQRRTEIAGVAAKLIATGGLEAATIRAIASASGFSKGVVEHYFENKQQIVQAALMWINTQYNERITSTTGNQRGLAALRTRIIATLPITREIRDEWKVRLVFYSLAAIEPGLRREQASRWRAAVAVFRADIDQAIAMGEAVKTLDSDARARQLLQATIGISTAALHDSSFYTAEQLTAEADRLVENLTSGRAAA